ncbi:hypothetical protein N9A84_01605 [Gammaproteobacteria bacterium]|nr:hypothetical protein [Gammaproteobacteria bacterium]
MQSKLLWIDIFLGITRLLGLFVSVLFYNALTAIAIYSMVSLIFFTFTVVGWFVYLRNRS